MRALFSLRAKARTLQRDDIPAGIWSGVIRKVVLVISVTANGTVMTQPGLLEGLEMPCGFLLPRK